MYLGQRVAAIVLTLGLSAGLVGCGFLLLICCCTVCVRFWSAAGLFSVVTGLQLLDLGSEVVCYWSVSVR